MLDSRFRHRANNSFGRLGLGLGDPNSLDELLDRSDVGHVDVLLDGCVPYFGMVISIVVRLALFCWRVLSWYEVQVDGKKMENG